MVVSYLTGVAALFDAYRRPVAAWEHADRERFHWGSLGAVMTFFAAGIIFAIAYLLLVVPRFGAASESTGDFKRNDFRGSKE